MDANDWQLEMRRLLEIFERESTSSLRQISRCLVVLGRPFDENFRQYFLKVSTLRLDTSFNTVLFEQCEGNTMQAIPNANAPIHGDASANSTNTLRLDNVRSLDAPRDSDVLELKIENNTNDTIEVVDSDDEDCGNQYGMQASNISNDDQIESDADSELNEPINTDMNDPNEIEGDVKAELKMEMESRSEAIELPFVAFDPTADNGDSDVESGETDAEPFTDPNQPSTSSTVKKQSGKSSVKRFKCNKCAYTAQYKCQVKSHQAIHEAVKPFKCAHCDYAARQKTHLGTHQRTHANQKSMGVVLGSNNRLLRCTYCAEQFPSWRGIAVHAAKSHKNNKRLFN